MITDEQILKEWNLVKRCENCTHKGATTTTYTGDGPRHECWCHITGNPGPLHDLYKTRECCSKWELSKWIRDSYLKKHPEIGEKK